MRALVFVSILAAGLVVAGGAAAQSTIEGSAHDLSATIGKGQVCLPCHTPHGAYSSGTVRTVLWNHQETTQTFQMYTTSTGHQGTPDGSSLLCLSCHDGVTAMDNFGGKFSGTVVMTGSAVVGTDLRDDHPIGIEYPTGDPLYRSVPDNELPLYNDGHIDRVECATCHDPHGAGLPNFLRDTMSGSQLCRDCHLN